MAQQSIAEIRADAGALPPTKALCHFAASLDWSHLDEEVRQHARRHFLDTLGCAISGAAQSATSTVGAALQFAGETASADASPVPGSAANSMGLLAATHLAGTAAHGLELDDGYRPGMMHPGCVVIPPVLMLGARLHVSGKAMLVAIAAGYEVACRLSAATHPKARWRGFHPTSAAGVFAAAVAAGKLLKLDAHEMESAMGIAASSSAGLFTFLDGGDVKRLHGGFGAREGLFAALLAKQGLIGPPNVLESANGYFTSHAGGDLPENDYSTLKILAAGGEEQRLAVSQCYLKPYASCRHIHGPVEMLLALRAQHGFLPTDVESIYVYTYAVAAAHGTPGWSEMTTAQMSMPYALAAALVRGKLTPAEFVDRERANPDITQFCSRVFTLVDPELDSKYPALRPARIEITLKDGRLLTAYVDEPPGEPGRRLSDSAVEEKFQYLAAPVLGADITARLLAQTTSLESCPDVNVLLRLAALASASPVSTAEAIAN